MDPRGYIGYCLFTTCCNFTAKVTRGKDLYLDVSACLVHQIGLLEPTTNLWPCLYAILDNFLAASFQLSSGHSTILHQTRAGHVLESTFACQRTSEADLAAADNFYPNGQSYEAANAHVRIYRHVCCPVVPSRQKGRVADPRVTSLTEINCIGERARPLPHARGLSKAKVGSRHWTD